MGKTKKAKRNMKRQERSLPPIKGLKNLTDQFDNKSGEPVDVLLNAASEKLNGLIFSDKNIDVRTVKILKN